MSSGVRVVLKDVGFKYSPSSPALDGITFSAEPGSVFGIVGPNGAGKTTLVKLLCGLRHPQEGALFYCCDDQVFPPNRMKMHMAVVHQQPAFDLMLPLLTNLRTYPLLRKTHVRDFATRVRGLAEALGLLDCLPKRVMELSGGQVRKAQLLRALLVEPRVLLLDEPTTGVDALSRRHMWELLAGLRRTLNTTILWTTHELQEMERRAERILILDKGRSVFSGNLSELGGTFSAEVMEMQVSDVDVAIRASGELSSVVDAEGLPNGRVRFVISPGTHEALLRCLLASGVSISSPLTRPLRLEEAIVMLSLKDGAGPL